MSKAKGRKWKTLGAALVATAALVLIGLAAVLGGPGAGAAAVFICAMVAAISLLVLNAVLTPDPPPPLDRKTSFGCWGRLNKAPLSAIGAWSLPADRARDARFLDYVARDVEGDLRKFIRIHQYVVVRGPSLAGKARTLYEAAKKEYGRSTLVIPDPSLARSLADLEDALPAGSAVIWLDDLNNYLELAGAGVNSGVTLIKLEGWLARRHWLTRKPTVRILATIREDAWDRVDDQLFPRGPDRDGQDRAERIAWEILHKGDRYDLPGPASADERKRAASVFPERIPEGLSFGEYLVRMPVMLEQLERAPLEERAVLWAAADWQRMGGGKSVGRDGLHSLWQAWVEQESGAPIGDADGLFGDALERVAHPYSDSTLSLITQPRPGTFEARDYFVAYREGQAASALAAGIPQPVWSATTKYADPDGLVRIGVRAEKNGLPSVAVASWSRAIEAGVQEMASGRAAFLLAAHYADRHYLEAAQVVEKGLWAATGESCEPSLRDFVVWELVELALRYTDAGYLRAAIRIGERLRTRSDAADDPEMRMYIAMGETNLALNYASAGNRREAVKIEDQLAARLQDSTRPKDRAILATVLNNLAGHHDDDGDTPAAIATGERLWSGFGDAGEPEIQAVVAGALANLANYYARAGNLEAAKAKEEGVWAGLGKVELPEWRLGYARGLRVLAIRYADAGDVRAAIATGERLRREFGNSQVPEMQQIVAGGLFHLANNYAQAGDVRAAIAIGEAMRREFGRAKEPRIRVWVAFLSNNLANLYADKGDLKAAISLGERMVSEYADEQAPEVRRAVAMALLNQAVHYKKAKQTGAAIATRQRLLAEFGRDREPKLRRLVAENLRALAENYHVTKDWSSAIATGERLWAEFGKDPDRGVRLEVARGLQDLVNHYADAGDLPAAARVLRRLRVKFARAARPDELVVVASSMLGLANHYSNTGDLPAGIALGEQLWVEFEQADAPKVRAVAASGLRTVAYRHGESKDLPAAKATVARLWTRFGNATEPEVRASAVNSWRDLAMSYLMAGKIRDGWATIGLYRGARRGT